MVQHSDLFQVRFGGAIQEGLLSQGCEALNIGIYAVQVGGMPHGTMAGYQQPGLELAHLRQNALNLVRIPVRQLGVAINKEEIAHENHPILGQVEDRIASGMGAIIRNQLRRTPSSLQA